MSCNFLPILPSTRQNNLLWPATSSQPFSLSCSLSGRPKEGPRKLNTERAVGRAGSGNSKRGPRPSPVVKTAIRWTGHSGWSLGWRAKGSEPQRQVYPSQSKGHTSTSSLTAHVLGQSGRGQSSFKTCKEKEAAPTQLVHSQTRAGGPSSAMRVNALWLAPNTELTAPEAPGLAQSFTLDFWAFAHLAQIP